MEPSADVLPSAADEYGAVAINDPDGHPVRCVVRRCKFLDDRHFEELRQFHVTAFAL